MTRAAGRGRAAPPAPSRRPHRLSRSTASRRRTPPRTCRPSRTRRQGEPLPHALGGRLATPATWARSRSPRAARLAVARSVAIRGWPARATRPGRADPPLERDRAADLGHEPRGDPGRPADVAPRHAAPSSARIRHSRLSDGARNRRRTIGRGRSLGEPGRLAGLAVRVDPADRRRRRRGRRRERPRGSPGSAPRRVLRERAGAGLLEAAERLVEGRPERPVDRHDLAGRLHLAAQAAVGARELVEREARQLDHNVVERRLERGDGRAGHDVRDLGEPAPRRDLGGHPGDRIAGRLGGERRARG